MSIDIESVFIKSEPQDEFLNSSDLFQHDTSHHITETVNPVKVEVKSEIDKSTKSCNNEENHESTTSVLCKNEPEYSFTSNEMDSKLYEVNVEQFSNKDNNVNALKIELLNHNENTWDTPDIIKQEDVDRALKVEVSESQNVTELVYPVKIEVKSDTEELARSSDNEEIYKNTSVVCKNEPEYSLNSNGTNLGCSKNNEQKSKKLSCQFCDKSYATKQSLNHHMLKNHSKDMKDCITYKIHTCKVCLYQTTEKILLDKHINSIHNKEISKKCQFCDKCFVTKRSLDNHMLKEHQSEIKNDLKHFVSYKIHTCKICSYQTTYKTKLDTHVSSMHNEQTSKKFTCQFCDKSWIKKQSLDSHIIKLHSKEISSDLITYKVYTCKVCPYQTTHKTRLDRHNNSMHSEQRLKKFFCQLCEKSFVEKRSLDNHMLKQHQMDIKTSVI